MAWERRQSFTTHTCGMSSNTEARARANSELRSLTADVATDERDDRWHQSEPLKPYPTSKSNRLSSSNIQKPSNCPSHITKSTYEWFFFLITFIIVSEAFSERKKKKKEESEKKKWLQLNASCTTMHSLLHQQEHHHLSATCQTSSPPRLSAVRRSKLSKKMTAAPSPAVWLWRCSLVLLPSAPRSLLPTLPTVNLVLLFLSLLLICRYLSIHSFDSSCMHLESFLSQFLKLEWFYNYDNIYWMYE